jgi:putative sigma-54 modulation protein
MNVEFASKHYELTDAVRTFALRRLKKIERFFGEEEQVQVRVVLKASRYRYEAEVLVFDEGEWLTAKSETGEMEESIVQCIDHLQTQLKKLKKKLKERKRREAHQHEAEWTEPPAPKGRRRAEASVERLRRSDVPPMQLEEALLRLKRATAGFLIYRDVEDDRIRILTIGRGGAVRVIDIETQ